MLSATYTDNGNGVVPLTSTSEMVLRPPTIQAADVDVIGGMERYQDMLGAIKSKAYFVLKGIDVKDIKQVTCNYAAKANAAAIEIHADSAKGALLSTQLPADRRLEQV